MSMLTTPPRKTKRSFQLRTTPEKYSFFLTVLVDGDEKNNETKCYEPLHDPSAPNALVLVLLKRRERCARMYRGGRCGPKYYEEIMKAPKGRRSMDVSDVVWV